MTEVPAATEPVTVVLEGSALDAHSAPEVRDQLTAAVQAAGTRRVLVDLTSVTFVDSTGLSVLIGARTLADQHGVRLILRRPQSQLLRLMSITATYALFTWDDGRRPTQ